MPPPKDPVKYGLYVQRQREARERVLADPEFRERFAEIMRKNNSDPTWRKSNSEGQKKLHADPERRKGFDAAMEKRSGNVVWRMQLAQRNREMSQSDVMKERHSKAMTGLMVGERNPLWKGGASPLNHKIRTSPMAEKFRSDVRLRDDYTCQFTGKRGGDLPVHHIIEFNILVSKHKIKTYGQAMSCKPLWDTYNGITMSEKVHRNYHSSDPITKIMKFCLK